MLALGLSLEVGARARLDRRVVLCRGNRLVDDLLSRDDRTFLRARFLGALDRGVRAARIDGRSDDVFALRG